MLIKVYSPAEGRSRLYPSGGGCSAHAGGGAQAPGTLLAASAAGTMWGAGGIAGSRGSAPGSGCGTAPRRTLKT